MATLTIRDFPDKERDKLRRRAQKNGRSMESEARQLLLESLTRAKQSQGDTKDWLKRVQVLVAKSTRKRGSADLLSEQFLRERRAMWGEE